MYVALDVNMRWMSAQNICTKAVLCPCGANKVTYEVSSVFRYSCPQGVAALQ